MDAKRHQQKSPSNRAALKPLNEDLSESLLILSSSNESKRDEINQLYHDMKLTADRLRANLEQQQTVVVAANNTSEVDSESSPLKRVHFEDDEDEENVLINATLNTTYTVEEFIEPKGTTSNTSVANVTTSAKSTRSRLPVKSSPVKRINQSNKISSTVQIIGTKIASRTSKSPTTNRPKVLSYQQRKALMLEAKEKLEKDLALIRQKIILRKFAHIWLRKHFYSTNSLNQRRNLLLPSQLNRLRTRKLISRSFKEWYSNVKFIRNEWRYNVKADCHYNYVLKNKIWDVWKEFVVEEKAEKIENSLALAHYNSKLIQACFYQWKQTRIDFRKREINLVNVQKLREQEMLKEHFNFWYEKLLLTKQLETMNEVAVKHNETYQLNKCFTIWYYKFNTEKEERRKIRLAKQHYRLKLLQRHFHSCQLYLINRRHKKVQNKKLAEYADSQLIYRTYQTWLQKYNERKQLNDMHDELVQIECKFLTRRVFNYWKSAREFSVKIRVKEIRARKFYEKKLKKKAFVELKRNNDEKRAEVARWLQAEKFEILWTKRLFFETWLEKLDEKRDINQMHLVYKAKKHHEINLVSNCLKSWKSYVLMQRDLKAKTQKADEFYARKTCRTYLDVMRFYVQLTKYKRHNHLIAEEIYKRNTWEKYFSLWNQNYLISIETQMNTRIAILHDQAKTMENVFNKWYLKYQEKIKDELNEVRAIEWNKKRLLKSSLKTWVQLYRQNKSQVNKETLAIQHDLKRLCSPIFDRWKSVFAQRQAIKQRYLDSSSHYDRSLKRRLFTAWHKETRTFREINRYVDESFKLKQKSRLTELWGIWRDRVSESRLERSKEHLALAFYSKRLILRVMTEWRGYITRRHLKRQNDEILTSDYKLITGVIIKRHFYHVWLKKSQERAAEEVKDRLALAFHERKEKNRAYEQWRMLTIEGSRQRVREKQADLFVEMRLKTEVFFRWSIRYNEECEMREKNINALLMWSINVQRKYFGAWFQWYRQQKAKSDRYKQALEDRQINIMRECGRKFLIYTWDAKQRRIESTRLLRERYQADDLALEEKYFHIWRTICEKKRPKPSSGRVLLKQPTNIESNLSIEKREKVTASATLINVNESSGKTLNDRRPAPRKPAHLLESIDVSLPPLPQQSQPEVQHIQAPKTVLLPPSAFAISTLNGHETNEMSSQTSKKKPRRESNTDNDMTSEMELIDIKRRLENLSIKSEKLKRLKEEEKLLINCIKSNEMNNTSMNETILKEKDQVQLEIEELTRFLKTEKHQINELLKKHKIT